MERIFSIINLNKTKIRNKLSVETLYGILNTKMLLKNNDCFNFDVGQNLLKKMNNEMYLKR